MPRFQVGDRVMHDGSPSTITEIHTHLSTSKGRKRLLWYSVKHDGMQSQYAVAQKANSLKKIRSIK